MCENVGFLSNKEKKIYEVQNHLITQTHPTFDSSFVVLQKWKSTEAEF